MIKDISNKRMEKGERYVQIIRERDEQIHSIMSLAKQKTSRDTLIGRLRRAESDFHFFWGVCKTGGSVTGEKRYSCCKGGVNHRGGGRGRYLSGEMNQRGTLFLTDVKNIGGFEADEKLRGQAVEEIVSSLHKTGI